MGLDMYLTREIYIGGMYEHRQVKGEINITAYGKKIPVDLSKVDTIRERVMYWRKANQIHNWFVQNVQNGEDDCKEYYVSYKQLQELALLCKKVLLEKEMLQETKIAKVLIPTQSGYFFGSTDYDDYYFEDIKETIEALENIDPESDYYYRASW